MGVRVSMDLLMLIIFLFVSGTIGYGIRRLVERKDRS